MPAPSPQSIALLLTQLLGRKVTVALSPAAKNATDPQIYGAYTIVPGDTAIVVKADLSLLSAFAGALVGLPASEAQARAKVTPMDETLHDAIYEVLNVFSAVITFSGRTVFEKMELNAAKLEGGAANVLNHPSQSYYFGVTMDGFPGGKLAIFL